MRFGSISGFPSVCEWSRTCWRRAGSPSATRLCGAGRRNSDGSTPTKSVRAPQFGDKWHLDEVVISINGKKHWLWRAVDADGFVLDALVQSRRDRRAAERLLRNSSANKLASHGLWSPTNSAPMARLGREWG